MIVKVSQENLSLLIKGNVAFLKIRRSTLERVRNYKVHNIRYFYPKYVVEKDDESHW